MPSLDVAIVPAEDIPAPPYRTPSDDVPQMYSVAKKMESLCRRLGGMGMSASQVGLPWRMFVFLLDPPYGDKFGCYFDCEYRPASEDKAPSVEGCLSLPGLMYSVDRHEEVVVSGKELFEGDEGPLVRDVEKAFSGLAAVLMQHEIDHDHGRERMIDSIGRRVHRA